MLCRILNWESVEMSERNTAIVLAAGQGKRMHSKVQKQFLEIQGYYRSPAEETEKGIYRTRQH